MLAKILMMVVFIAAVVAIGLRTRGQAGSVEGFVLGGRNVGPWLSAFAYGTSYFSAVIFVGYAGQFGWKYGISATWIGVGNAFIGSLLAWVVLGRRTRLMTHRLGSATMPQFFGSRYGSEALRVASAAIIFIFLIPYTASVYNGLSRLFEMAFGIDYTICIIGMAIVTCVYVVLGGYMATVVNDFVQGVVMLVGIVAIIAAVLKDNGGFMTAITSLSQIPVEGSEMQGALAGFFGPDPLNLLGVVILTSLGTWGLPQMVQKFYAIKHEKDIRKGTVISTGFAIIVAGGCYFLGGFGRLFDVDVAANGYDAIIPTMLSTLPDILIAVVVILVLSASMSTLSSLVIASSSTLTIDLLKGNIIKKMSDKKQVVLIRIFIVVFIAISAFIAIYQTQSKNESVKFIAQLMGVSWGALAGAFLAPFLYGLYWKKTTKLACWVSFIFGAGVMVLNLFFRSFFPVILQSPINCGAFTMIAGLIIVPLVSLISPKPDKQLVDDAFACYEKRVPAAQKRSLD